MLVAQPFSLVYRGLVVGRAGDGVEAFDLADALQSATLRYSRLQTCATSAVVQLVSAEADDVRG